MFLCPAIHYYLPAASTASGTPSTRRCCTGCSRAVCCKTTQTCSMSKLKPEHFVSLLQPLRRAARAQHAGAARAAARAVRAGGRQRDGDGGRQGDVPPAGGAGRQSRGGAARARAPGLCSVPPAAHAHPGGLSSVECSSFRGRPVAFSWANLASNQREFTRWSASCWRQSRRNRCNGPMYPAFFALLWYATLPAATPRPSPLRTHV